MSKLKPDVGNSEKIIVEDIKNDNFWNDCIDKKRISNLCGNIKTPNINNNSLLKIDIKNRLKNYINFV